MENNKTRQNKGQKNPGAVRKKDVDHRRRGNNNQIIWSAVTRRRAPPPPVTCSFGKKEEKKKLRGEQEDTRDDPDESRVNVYSFNTDKYSYVSAARI